MDIENRPKHFHYTNKDTAMSAVFGSNEESTEENSEPQPNQYTPRTYEEYQELR